MEKNNALTIIFLIVVVVGIGGYYTYQKVGIPGLPGGHSDGPIMFAGKECPLLTNVVTDGLFDRTENGMIYFYPKDKVGSAEGVSVNDETVYYRTTLSSAMELVSQVSISLSSLKDGDQVSMIVFCGKEATDSRMVQEVKVMVVQ